MCKVTDFLSKKVNARAAILSVLGLVAVMSLAMWFSARPSLPVAKANAPLLQSESTVFRDDATRFEFTPPGNWSMQMRTVDTGDELEGERPLVKFKRLMAGYDPAWIKVSVADVPEGTSLGSLVQKRAPGQEWKASGSAEDTTVNNLPASKVSFSGQWDGVDFTRDVVAIRRGGQVFFVAMTFQKGDPSARRRLQQAIDSIQLKP